MTEMNNKSDSSRGLNLGRWDWQLAVITAAAFFIRGWAAVNTQVVNLDGLIYVHQARALYFGLWDQLTSCTDRYLSNFPLLIAAAYPFTGNWITAAQVITVSFGALTVVPIYLMSRRFFKAPTAGLVSLAFAFIPTLVGRSADAVRGPVYWFFLAWGLCLFLAAMDRDEKWIRRGWYALASLLLMMAAWARIEAGLIAVASMLFIPFVQKGDRIGSTLAFLAPAVAAAALSLGVMAAVDTSLIDIFRFQEMGERISRPISQYVYVRDVMDMMRHDPVAPIVGEYLDKARNMIWLVALGTLVRFLAEAYYYPFAGMGLIGLIVYWRRIFTDRRVLYLISLFCLSLVLFFTLLLETWVMERRYLALAFIPTFVFLGFGYQAAGQWFKNKFLIGPVISFIILATLTVGSTLYKNLEPREVDKGVYARIGIELGDQRPENGVISLTSNSPLVARWVSFYANLDYKGAPCPAVEIHISQAMATDPHELSRVLKKTGVEYFLWARQHNWPANGYWVGKRGVPGFTRMHHWYHPDTDKIILFRRDSGG